MKHIIQLTTKLLSSILFVSWTLYPLIALSNCDQIQNGNFSNKHNEWIASVHDKPGVKGSVTFVNDTAYFKIDSVGIEKWYFSLEQRGIHIQSGESYQIRFKAKSNVERPITVAVSDIGGTYPTLSKSNQDFDITTKMEVYEYAFNADVNDFTARIIFMLGAQSGDVYIDDVSMKKLNCENCPPAGTPCDDKDACTINDKTDGLCNCAGQLTSNNQIINGDFSGNFYDAWNRTIRTEDGAIAELVYNQGEAHFEIEQVGIENWNIALEQRNLSIEANQHYKISFRAKASEARDINVKISDIGGIFDTYFSQDVALTNSFQDFIFDYEAPVTDTLVRIIFNMGLDTPDVSIDDISFEQYNCEVCDNYGLVCDDGDPCTITDKYDASCNCVSYTEKEQYISNGNFDNQFAGWMETIYPDSGAEATTTFEDNLAHIKIEKDGTQNWHISLEQRDLPFVAGESYAINFRAKASISRMMNLKISDLPPNANITYFNEDLALTEDWQAYHYIFNPEATDNFARIIFNMGIDQLNTGVNEIFIDDVAITNTACLIYSPVHPEDSLALVKFYKQNCNTDCELDWYLSRPVHTWGGVEIENGRVVALKVAGKGLSGNMESLDLPMLKELDLSNNNFKEGLDDFSNLPQLTNFDVSKNQLSFEAVAKNFQSNSAILNYVYSPQYLGEEKTHVIQEGAYQYLVEENELFPDSDNLYFQWKKNNEIIVDEITPNYRVKNMNVDAIGIYTLHLTNENLVPGLEIIATHYVFMDGYDIKGQRIYKNQIMVLFDSEEERDYYTALFIDGNDGAKVAFSCDCTRLLYLWEFKSSEAAAKVLLDIDKKRQTLTTRTEIDSNPNNFYAIDSALVDEQNWKWPKSYEENLTDSISIYLLDSGVDLANLENDEFLIAEAPLMGCDKGKTSGYGFVTNHNKISIDFDDANGHGTYGYGAITDGIENINQIKVVPVKTFNQKGEGSLFHIVCGLYHSIDNNADIINISAGFKEANSSILEAALQLAQQQGIFIITAAGNDAANIDYYPQYPAYYAGQFYQQERLDATGSAILNNEGQPVIDTIAYDNIISIAAINSNNQLCDFSNYGAQSVTMSAYGENLYGNGLNGIKTVYSGTSMATFYTTRLLAIEMAKNKNREYIEIWDDFEEKHLVLNENTIGKTITGKQIKVNLEKMDFKKNSILTKNKDIKVFPNPSNGKIIIEFNNKNSTKYTIVELKIFNIFGREVLRRKILEGEILSIDASGLNKGSYIIKLHDNNNEYYGKMIIN